MRTDEKEMAMVQQLSPNPASQPGRLTDLLVDEHHELDESLAAFDWMPQEDRADRFVSVVSDIVHHEIAEQAVLYRAIEHLKYSAQLVDDGLAQQEGLVRRLAAVAALDPASEQFRLALRGLRQSLAAHAHHEETQVFPVLMASVDDARAGQLLERYLQVLADSGDIAATATSATGSAGGGAASGAGGGPAAASEGPPGTWVEALADRTRAAMGV